MIKILLADDHKLVRGGLLQIMELTTDIEVLCEAENGTQVIDCLDACAPSVVLLDLSMPDGGHLLIERINRAKPKLPILVLSMHNEPEMVAGALRAGALGYATKDCDVETLLFAIRRVSLGEQFVESRLTRSLIQARKNPPRHAHLSPRELEVLKLLASGKSVTKIGNELNLSVKTVSTHKSNMMQKLGIDNTAGLVRYAMETGLV